jgi:hypothetical protein
LFVAGVALIATGLGLGLTPVTAAGGVLFAGAAWLAVALFRGTAWFDGAIDVFIVIFGGGWILQTLLGACLYLLPMSRPGHPDRRRAELAGVEWAGRPSSPPSTQASRRWRSPRASGDRP